MAETIQSFIAGGVVVGKNGQVVVVNQNNDSWSLPKGHIETGEDPLAAARREIAEETGITELELIKDLGSYKRYKLGFDGKDDTGELKQIRMFLFTTPQDFLAPRDPANPEARWVDASEVSKLLTHHKDKEFFEQVKQEVQTLPE